MLIEVALGLYRACQVAVTLDLLYQFLVRSSLTRL